MTRRFRVGAPLLLLLAAAVVFLPGQLTSSLYRLNLLSSIAIYVILALAVNLTFGYTGLLFLGPQAFFALSAYAFALLQLRVGVPMLPAAALAVLVAGALSMVVGIPALRLRGHYLAMATLAMALIVNGMALRWISLTNGPAGLTTPSPAIGSLRLAPHVYQISLTSGMALLLVAHLVVTSHFGRALRAIRDDELAAATSGVPVFRYKLAIFLLAGLFSGVAGILYAMTNRQVLPDLSGLSVIVKALTAVVVGGLGSNAGATVGGIIVILLPQLLAKQAQLQLFLYGGLVLFAIIFFPAGVVGVLGRLWAWVRRRTSGVRDRRTGALSLRRFTEAFGTGDPGKAGEPAASVGSQESTGSGSDRLGG